MVPDKGLRSGSQRLGPSLGGVNLQNNPPPKKFSRNVIFITAACRSAA
jgi:hypothetical protein